ncbi:pre-16S rRNA-processing nuclease YqgF [bacterium]|nr:pre-16S rRNA-processing nuclease YqgF [bacterium]
MSDGILALDWGLKKVGLAKADIKGIVVSPRSTWQRAPAGQIWSLTSDDKSTLMILIQQEEPALLILGDPRGPQGEETPSSINAKRFARKLEDLLSIPVALVPEQNTSWEQKGADNEDSLVACALITSFFEDPTLIKLKEEFLNKVQS